MTIELYRDNEPYPVRYYENPSPVAVRKVRSQWVKEVKHLKGDFYIKVIPNDVRHDMERFERYLQNKLAGIKDPEAYERLLENLSKTFKP